MSFVITLTAWPKQSGSIKSKSSPSSSFITLAPVTAAKSATVSSFVGPKPGKSIKLTFILPLTLLANNAALGCCSSSPTINKDLFCFIQYSNTVCIFLMLGIAVEDISIVFIRY